MSKPREKESCVADRYHVFAATMPDSWMGSDPLKAAEFYRMRWGDRKLLQVARADAARNDRPPPLRPPPADHYAVHILQYVDVGPLHGGTPRQRPQRGGRQPAAAHAEPLHDDAGGRGGQAVGRTWRASAD